VCPAREDDQPLGTQGGQPVRHGGQRLARGAGALVHHHRIAARREPGAAVCGRCGRGDDASAAGTTAGPDRDARRRVQRGGDGGGEAGADAPHADDEGVAGPGAARLPGVRGGRSGVAGGIHRVMHVALRRPDGDHGGQRPGLQEGQRRAGGGEAGRRALAPVRRDEGVAGSERQAAQPLLEGTPVVPVRAGRVQHALLELAGFDQERRHRRRGPRAFGAAPRTRIGQWVYRRSSDGPGAGPRSATVRCAGAVVSQPPGPARC
jgi:hypothetical protein